MSGVTDQPRTHKTHTGNRPQDSRLASRRGSKTQDSRFTQGGDGEASGRLPSPLGSAFTV